MLKSKTQSQIKNEEKGVKLLISMLLRYPVIDLLDIDLTENQIIFTFFLANKNQDNAESKNKLNLFKKSLNCFNQLEEITEQEFSIKSTDYKQLVKIDLAYRVFCLTQKKLDFIIKLITEIFKKEIHLDKFNLAKKNSFESLDNLLTVIEAEQEKDDEFTYLAFREDDKIKIFNKANYMN